MKRSSLGVAIRRCALVGLAIVSTACATIPREEASELIFVVETKYPLPRIEFTSDDGMPFMLDNTPPGVTVYRCWVPPGEYCLTQAAVGSFTAGVIFQAGDGSCVRARARERIYGGHFAFTGSDMHRFSNPQRLEEQLADPSVRKVDRSAGVRPPGGN